MEIIEAYCEDLGRVVEIYEAQEEYFSQPAGNRHRFQFRCSDAACRAENNPLVVGVNYDKNSEESDKYQQPHFKSHAKHPHIDACIWMEGDTGRHKENFSGNERDVRHPCPKATNVVDVFEPRHSDTLLTATAAVVRPPAVVSGNAAQEGGSQTGNRTGISTTSRLEKLIDCWSQMEPDERRNHRIVIKGRTLTYHQLCLRVGILSEEENGTRIVYGGARVKAWPADVPKHYYVNFMDGCDRFPEVTGARSLTISLPIKRLKQSRRGALLMDRIEQASKPGHYLQVYAWGDIVARAGGKKGYELNLAALDNLVLKAIKSKKAQHQHTFASGASEQASQRASVLPTPATSLANRPVPVSLAPVTLPPPSPPVGSTPTHERPVQPRPADTPVQPTQLPTAAPVVSTPITSRREISTRAMPTESQGLMQRLSTWWRRFRNVSS